MEKKNVPEIRFKGFEDEWEERNLEEVATYRNGKAHENSISKGGKYIVVNSKFVSTDGEEKKFSDEQYEPLYKNEIAFVLSDVPNGRALARTFLVDKNNKYTLNQRIAGIEVKENFNHYFLYRLMNRHRYFLSFDDGVKQTNLSITDVKNFKEFYPNINEQNEISRLLYNLDKKLELEKEKHKKFEDFKKSMLENMFPKEGENVPKLRFNGFDGEWKCHFLGSIVEIIMGQSPDSSNYTNNPDDYILVQGNADLINSKVFPRVWTKQITRFAEPEDIIFTVRAPVGDVGVTNYKVVIGRGVAAIRGNEFIYYSLVKLNYEGYWKKLSTGSTFDAINSKEIKNVKILLPSIQEQEQIGIFFKNLDEKIEASEEKIKKIEEFKKSLMEKMFV